MKSSQAYLTRPHLLFLTVKAVFNLRRLFSIMQAVLKTIFPINQLSFRQLQIPLLTCQSMMNMVSINFILQNDGCLIQENIRFHRITCLQPLPSCLPWQVLSPTSQASEMLHLTRSIILILFYGNC